MTLTVDDVEAGLAGVPVKPADVPLRAWISQQYGDGQQVWDSLPQQARVTAVRVVEFLPHLAGRLSGVAEAHRRGEAVQQVWQQRVAEANKRVVDARKAFAADPGGLSGLLAARRELAELEAAKQDVTLARRTAHSGAATAFGAALPGIWEALRAEAGRIVAQVSALLPLPEPVWGAAEPDQAMVSAGRAEQWGTLLAAWLRWVELHAIADGMRDQLGYDAANLKSAAPGPALVYRQWERWLSDGEPERFRRLPKPLRLPYAVRAGWEPGLWRPDEVDAPKNPTTAERLKAAMGGVINLGRPAA